MNDGEYFCNYKVVKTELGGVWCLLLPQTQICSQMSDTVWLDSELGTVPATPASRNPQPKTSAPRLYGKFDVNSHQINRQLNYLPISVNQVFLWACTNEIALYAWKFRVWNNQIDVNHLLYMHWFLNHLPKINISMKTH